MRVVVVDVTDDYTLMQPPMPSSYYPVLQEIWLPRHNIGRSLAQVDLISGYLYDWHEMPMTDEGSWYVGVVSSALAAPPISA